MKNELNFLLPPKKKPVLDEEWLTSGEITELFEVKSPTTIRKYLKPQKFGGRCLYPLSNVRRLWRKKKPLEKIESVLEQASKEVEGKEREAMQHYNILEKYVRCIISETGSSHMDNLHKHYTDDGTKLFTQKEKEFLCNIGLNQSRIFTKELTLVRQRVTSVCRHWVKFLNEKEELEIIEHSNENSQNKEEKVNEKP